MFGGIVNRNWAILVASGLATSVLTAYFESRISTMTGISIFTFAVWFIVPIGALGCGFVAASVYYFASRNVQFAPSKFLLLQMIVVAAIAQILIYWFDYQRAFLPDGSLQEVMSFGQYIDLVLTRSHYSMGPRAPTIDAGEIRDFGYVLAAIQFAGFLAGGFATYFHLDSQPKCNNCDAYLQASSVVKGGFDS
jgi:hypothetical protein